MHLLWLAAAALASGTASPKPAPPPAVDFSSLPASAAVRPPAIGGGEHPVLARLITDRATVAPGEPFRLGVVIEQKSEWHTYWKAPGDVGTPTAIVWKLPNGSSASPYDYPAPQRFEAEGVVSYGYEDGVVLFSDVTLPTDLPAGPITLGAHVSWLVCREQCIPGKTDLELPITVGTTSAPGPFAALFDHYAAQHPVPLASIDGITVDVTSSIPEPKADDSSTVTVRIAPKEGHTLDMPVEVATWPAFAPRYDNAMFMGNLALAKDDGAYTATYDVYALGGDEVVPTTTIGGLIHANVDGKPITTEVTKSIPRSDATLAALPPIVEFFDPTVAAVTPTVAAPPPEQASTLFMLFAAWFGGIILNVMPCVLPVLTLKLYGLVENAAVTESERRKAGILYTAGILVTFTALAVTVIVLKTIFGEAVGWGFQMSFPLYNAALAALVFAFSLSLFGVFEIPVVGADHMSEAGSGGGSAGHFFMGVFAVLLGTPCSAPFLAPAMGFAFSQGPATILGFFALAGLGLATPFLLVAFIPALFRLFPAPGPWMETFKQVLGFALAGTAIWLTSVLMHQIGPDRTVTFLWFLGAVAVGAWAFGRYGGLTETLQRQVAVGALAIVGTGAVGYGTVDLTPMSPATCIAYDETPEYADGEIPWQPFCDEASLEGLHAPVFVDMTAEWCLTCKVTERTVIDTAPVYDAMKSHGVIALRGDWTNQDPAITALLQKYGRAGVPFYLYIPADRSKPPVAMPDLMTQTQLLHVLDSDTL